MCKRPSRPPEGMMKGHKKASQGRKQEMRAQKCRRETVTT